MQIFNLLYCLSSNAIDVCTDGDKHVKVPVDLTDVGIVAFPVSFVHFNDNAGYSWIGPGRIGIAIIVTLKPPPAVMSSPPMLLPPIIQSA